MNIANLPCFTSALLLLFATVSPGFAKEEPAKLVSELFDVIYSDGPLSPEQEARFFSKMRNDVRACLRATPKYAASAAPILEFLRDNRRKLFETEERSQIAIFSGCRLLTDSAEGSRHEFVFAMVRWDKHAAIPPVLMIQFVFRVGDGVELLSGPDLTRAEAMKSLYDVAFEHREREQKD